MSAIRKIFQAEAEGTCMTPEVIDALCRVVEVNSTSPGDEQARLPQPSSGNGDDAQGSMVREALSPVQTLSLTLVGVAAGPGCARRVGEVQYARA